MDYPYYKINDIFIPTEAAPKFTGALDHTYRAVANGLYRKIDFSKTVDMFRNTLDLFAAGEFWGKLMRAACILYECIDDAALGDILRTSMEDMLSVQKPDGEISCTPRSAQPNGTHGSDLWERKYVLLGMLAYYRVFKDKRVLDAMCRLADYTCAQVGSASDGKTPVTETGWAFCGIESSSILEPMVKLYGVTGKPQYLTLACHIVEETGACKRENIFTAIENGKSPYEIGGTEKPEESIAKAYEMMSCFEGLCEYYRATGVERWKTIALRFFDRLLEEEITLLGSGGADQPYNLGPGKGEQWNRTRYEQTNPNIMLMQETCVTITWMKLCLQLLRLTGDPRCADEIERSYENALLGALRPDGAFFDYFPKFNGTRGGQVNFTYNIGDMPLSCCTANGPAGLAMLRDAAVMETRSGAALLLFLPGEYHTEYLKFRLTVSSCRTQDMRLVCTMLCAEPIRKTLQIRIPAWADDCKILALPEDTLTVRDGGYLYLTRIWQNGDTVTLSFGRSLRVVSAPHGSVRAGDPFFALTFGSMVMARDKRFDACYDKPLSMPASDADHGNRPIPVTMAEHSGVRCAVSAVIGQETVQLVDYASAGSTWDDSSTYRTWLPIK